MAEVAKLKGVNVSTANRWCAIGRLQCYRVGSQKLTTQEWLEAMKPAAKPGRKVKK
jgi:predicted site-specific integrase-resolvase